MNKSTSVMKNIQDICSELRKKFFGEHASSKDYKDSFVVNNAIERFDDLPEKLMIDTISVEDQKDTKISKSINYRSDCYEKICTYSKILQIPEAEVCRRILYYSLESKEKKNTGLSSDIHLKSLKNKVMLLKKQIDTSAKLLNEVMEEVELLENR